MQELISALVLAATFMQFVLTLLELRRTHGDAARWSTAEDDLVAEQPLWRRRQLKRELRSWRPHDLEREIRHLNATLASWLLLVAAASMSFVYAVAT